MMTSLPMAKLLMPFYSSSEFFFTSIFIPLKVKIPLTFSLAQRRGFTTAPGYNCAEHIGYLYYAFFKTDSLYCLKRVSGNKPIGWLGGVSKIHFAFICGADFAF
ncbi:TPA: hypothetical protein WIY92_000603 [Neisseria meningitidis]